MAARKTNKSRAVGNKRKMTKINPEYIHSYFIDYCKKNNTTQKHLSEECGWSAAYINHIKRLDQLPESALQLLCSKYGLDYKKATDSSDKIENGCNYCSQYSENTLNDEFFHYETPIFSLEEKIEAGNVMVTYLGSPGGDQLYIFGAVEVNFCPFCGKKLKNNENERVITKHPHFIEEIFGNL